MKRNLYIIFHVILFLTVVSIFRVLPFDNYNWFLKEDSFFINKKVIDKTFNIKESFVIAVEAEDKYFSKPFLNDMRKMTKELEKITFVNRVQTPLNASAVFNNDGYVVVDTFDNAIFSEKIISLKTYKNLFKQSPYYGMLLSKDFQTCALILSIDINDTQEDFKRRKHVYSEVQNIVKNYPQFSNHYYTGDSFLFLNIDQDAFFNVLFLMGLSFVMLMLTMYFVFRSFCKVLIICAGIISSLWVTATIVFLLNHPITIINIILFVVIVVISLTDIIHIFKRWDFYAYINNKEERLSRTLKEIWKPCLATSLTTAIGFGSFYLAKLVPFKYFGMESFFSILGSYVVVLLSVFIGLKFFKSFFPEPRTKIKKVSISLFFYSIFNFVKKYGFSIILSCLLIFLAFSFLALQLKTETNFLNTIFGKESKIYKDFSRFDTTMAGTGTIDIVVEHSDKAYAFNKAITLQSIYLLIENIQKIPLITHVRSYIDPIRMVHSVLVKNNKQLPQKNDELEQELLFLEFSRNDKEKDMLSSYVDFNYAKSIITVQTKNLSLQQIKNVVYGIKLTLKSFSMPVYFLAGTNWLFFLIEEYILSLQIKSLTLTFFIIWFVFMLFVGFKYGSIAMLPNLFPIAITMGTISICGYPIDFAIVLIASISFGLCVDDTIHFIHFFMLQKERGLSVKRAVQKTIYYIGAPILETSIVLVIGFGVFMFSNLALLRKFGFFTVMTIVIAFISDVILLPSLLLLDKSSIKKKSKH